MKIGETHILTIKMINKKIFGIVLFSILLFVSLLSVNALPYNVDITSSKLLFYQYMDNETSGILNPTWLRNTGKTCSFIVNDTIYNASTGKSMSVISNGCGYNFGRAPAVISIVNNVDIITAELDFYFSAIATTNTYWFVGVGKNDATNVQFMDLRMTGSANVKYSSTELSPVLAIETGKWYHYKMIGNLSDNTFTLIVTNLTGNGGVKNWTAIPMTISNDATLIASSFYIFLSDLDANKIGYYDNFIIYNGTTPPVYTIPVSNNITYYKPYNNSVNLSYLNTIFYYNVIADNLIKNCSIYIDNILNATNSSIPNKNITAFYFNNSVIPIIDSGTYFTYSNINKYINNLSFIYLKYSPLSNLILNISFYYNNSNNVYTSQFFGDQNWYKVNVTFPYSNFIVDSIKILQYTDGTGGLGDFSNITLYGYDLNSFTKDELSLGKHNFTINCYNSLDTLFTNGISYFSTNDSSIPVCSKINNTLIDNNTQYTFNISCSDDISFYLFNLTCSNGLYDYVDTINLLSYNYLSNMSINENISCHLEYCDGHTDLLMKNVDTKQIRDSEIAITFDKIETTIYTPDNSIITPEQKKDRVTFKVDYSTKSLTNEYVIYYQATENSRYISSTKYKAWIVDTKTKTWFDLNEKTKSVEKTKVEYLENGLWKITLTSNKNTFEFESIGKINCVEDTFNIDIIPYPPLNLISLNTTCVLHSCSFLFDMDNPAYINLTFNGVSYISPYAYSTLFTISPLSENTIFNYSYTTSGNYSNQLSGSGEVMTTSFDEANYNERVLTNNLFKYIIIAIILFVIYILSEIFKVEMIGILAGIGFIIFSFTFMALYQWLFILILFTGVVIFARSVLAWLW